MLSTAIDGVSENTILKSSNAGCLRPSSAFARFRTISTAVDRDLTAVDIDISSQ